jgi:hypothetical protein
MASAPLTLPAQSASSSKGSSGGSAVPGEGATGFSIETEMLTYRALESNGEAIACDVASYLEGVKTSFQVQATGAVCAVPSASGPSTVGVVILPFDRTVFGDFLIWRSDMQTMAEFEQRAANACNTTAPDSTGTSTQPAPPRPRGLSLGSIASDLTPAGSALSAASGVLGMFASDHAATPVGGTIEDQAFMNNVSRELRAINVSVLMPDVYTPYALTSIDPTRSPFVIALDKLLHTRDCLVNNKTTDDPDVKNIDGFLASLSASSNGPAKPAAIPAASTTSTTPGTTTTTTSAPAPAAPPAPSRLESALMADGLAQRLGADANGKIPGNAPHHLLLIKALESGGSVNKSTNIFGTKMSFSGGSVGTYALFNLNGDLECSGNVYDYAGTIPAKDFQKQLHAFVPDPNNEVIFQRGTCTQLQPH